MTEPPSDLATTIQEIIEEFDLLGDEQSKFEHVVDLGKSLNSLAPEECTTTNEIPNCAFKAWMISEIDGGRLLFRASSDSIISKGNICLMLRVFNRRTPDEILSVDAKGFLDRLGLPQALSRQRANGLNGVVSRIRGAALSASERGNQNALGSPAS
jgi:cysteine desulfuration protein SufE